MKSLGQWNAYVEDGKTKEERNNRPNEVPEELKAIVKSHVIMAFKLNSKKNK